MQSPSVHSAKRVALVTGAAGIIGPTICDALEKAGWRVAASDLSASQFQNCENIHGTFARSGEFYSDLSSLEAGRALVSEVEASLGPIALLVHGAADERLNGRIEDLTPEVFQQSMAVNLGAPLFMIQAALPSLEAQKGSVIFVSSILVSQFAPGRLLYSTSKAAIEKMTEALTFELAERGIRVNCLRLGAIPGPAFLRPVLNQLPPEKARALCQHILPRHQEGYQPSPGVVRRGKPRDIAEAIEFLASDKAHFINGTTLALDGGIVHRAPTPNSARSTVEQSWDLVESWLDANGYSHLKALRPPERV